MAGGIRKDAAGHVIPLAQRLIMTRSSLRIAAMALGLGLFALPTAAPAQQANAAAPFGASAIGDEVLHGIAGREDTQQAATANQVAGVSQNSVGDNVRTGDARISDNAFQNMSGLSILNVNTGNNVAINAALNVNISLQPAP